MYRDEVKKQKPYMWKNQLLPHQRYPQIRVRGNGWDKGWAKRLYEYSTVDNTVEILNYKMYMLKNVQNYIICMYILYVYSREHLKQ